MHTLRQYLLTLADPEGLLRTLGGAEVCRNAEGRPLYAVGNSAVVFRIRHGGRIRSLRCYLRPMRHLREIYGERLLERELFLYDTSGKGSWVDAVVGDWIEGVTLAEAAERAATEGNTERLRALAAAFDRMAAAMLSDDRAHGDLKPANIIVDPEGQLHPIDFDAAFLPQFAGEPSPELGTAAYQHPSRTAADFNARLDDYPAALISTALHALSIDPSFAERYADCDGLLFTPSRVLGGRDDAYREVMELFERHGMALRYRIAQMLASPRLEIPGLAALLTEDDKTDDPDADTEVPELFVEEGRWGFRTTRRVVVPPLYDNGFDFSEGVAAVQLGRTWHYIGLDGHVRLSCPACDMVKPFRNGRAQVVCHGRRMEIDHQGRVYASEQDPAKR